MSKPEEVAGLVEGLPEELREVDVLVNNAYVLDPFLDLLGFLTKWEFGRLD